MIQRDAANPNVRGNLYPNSSNELLVAESAEVLWKEFDSQRLFSGEILSDSMVTHCKRVNGAQITIAMQAVIRKEIIT
jgi:hypothetical protein